MSHRWEGTEPDASGVPALARGPVLAAMAAVAVVLTLTSDRYGFHRDELYFRMLRPAWGYVDQPPLAPLLARLLGHVSDQPWALRIPATLATAASVLAVTLVTRELGGRRLAQGLCAWGYGFAALPMIMGHALLTSTLDLVVWPLLLWCVLRAELRQRPRWWLVAGLVAGLSTFNKLLVVVLLVALLAGIALVGPRRLLVSGHVWGAAGIAAVVALPNLVYQASHGWPQLAMGHALAAHNGGAVRVQMWPFLLLMLGPPLVPVWVAGLVALWRRPAWRPVRFLVPAFPVLLLLVCVMGSQLYYPFGLVAVLFAAGCVPTERWLARRSTAWVAAPFAVNAAVAVLLGLPVVPLGDLGGTPIPAINQVARDTVGWPAYVAEVEGVAQSGRVDAIVASNYGEAGALARYGRGLPPVYSGQNALWEQARPADTVRTVAVVGGQYADLRPLFASCRVEARLDDHVGVDNEEQGEPVAVCRGPRMPWTALWPRLRHLD